MRNDPTVRHFGYVFILRFYQLTAAISNVLQSHVILAYPKDQEQVHVFTADIPSTFLESFDVPTLVPPAPVPVSIRHTTVPFEPYKMLHSRLRAIIVPASYSKKQKHESGEVDDEDATRNIAPGQPHYDGV